MQTSRLGGSIDSEDMAVAVMPIGCPSTQMVITFTVEATRRIAWRKPSLRAASLIGRYILLGSRRPSDRR